MRRRNYAAGHLDRGKDMEKIVLKICIFPWQSESRDKRELSACRELGLTPLVMAKGDEKDWYREDEVSGFRVLRFSTRPLGRKILDPVNWVATMVSWAWCARKLKPAVISGHDIVALTIGWMSAVGMSPKKKPKLVYDSHEFELGRNAKRSKLQLFCLKQLERFLMNRCAFSIMVNDAIADEVQKIHGLKERPIVVRSTPNRWTVDPEVCRNTRQALLSAMQSPEEMLLMYHGGVMRGRGVEMLLQEVQKNPKVCAVILGNGEQGYMAELKAIADNLGVSDRVLFHPAVPLEDLWKYVGAADVGMVTVPAVARSYYYMLPNKFFENIQSETPVICSNFPAVAPIVNQYGIGLTCDPEKLEEIHLCVEKMRTDKAFYAQCKENLKKAKEDLCWEKERVILQEAYRRVMV